jgi:hypothetical protein
MIFIPWWILTEKKLELLNDFEAKIGPPRTIKNQNSVVFEFWSWRAITRELIKWELTLSPDGKVSFEQSIKLDTSDLTRPLYY